MKTLDKKHKRIKACIALLTLSLSILSACTQSSDTVSGEISSDDPFYGRDASIVLGYEGMEGYEGEIMLRDTTVLEVKELMDAKETFVVYCGYENCPWCNLIIPYLNDAAQDAGVLVGYIDTRAKPEWQNNMDIDDYDVFAEMFSQWLTVDDDGKHHLYVPDIYFIRKGKVVARHDGVTSGAEDPSEPLTNKQEEQLRKDLADKFDSLR